MNNLIIPKNHYSHKHVSDIINICEPLHQYGITYFTFLRFYKKTPAHFFLTTHWDSINHHCSQQYNSSLLIHRASPAKTFHYFPFITERDCRENPAARNYIDLFNLAYPIFFVEMNADYTDIFIYCSAASNSKIINFYMNNIDLLEKFKLYFKEKAHKLINKSFENRLILPEPMRLELDATNHLSTTPPTTLDKFTPKRIFLPNTDQSISITRREKEAIKFISTGHTIKEAAKVMELSPRTVEGYLNNLKTKLNLQKRSDIIRLLINMNIL